MAKKFMSKSKTGEGSTADLSNTNIPAKNIGRGATAKPNPSRSISLYNASSNNQNVGNLVDRYGSSDFLSRIATSATSSSSTVTSPSSSEPPPPPPPFMLSDRGGANRFSTRYYNRSESDLLNSGFPISGSGSYLPQEPSYYPDPMINRNPDGLNRDPGRSAFQVYTVGGQQHPRGHSNQLGGHFEAHSGGQYGGHLGGISGGHLGGEQYEQHQYDRNSPEIQIFGNEVQFKSAGSNPNRYNSAANSTDRYNAAGISADRVSSI